MKKKMKRRSIRSSFFFCGKGYFHVQASKEERKRERQKQLEKNKEKLEENNRRRGEGEDGSKKEGGDEDEMCLLQTDSKAR